MNIKRLIKLRLIKLMRIRDKLECIARGFAWGTFLAIWPSVPFNTILCFLAPLFGGNIMAAIIASWTVGPFFISPVYYYLSYLTGKYLFKLFRIPIQVLHYEQIEKFILKISENPFENIYYYFFTSTGLKIFWKNVEGFFFALMIGGLILGIIGAYISYKSIWWIRDWFIEQKKKILIKRKLKIEKRSQQQV
ncbi:MAG TPA: DUF2062 domain-containing protein [bacterium]|nr:DUF2062 domain-containing protein [bacterium]